MDTADPISASTVIDRPAATHTEPLPSAVARARRARRLSAELLAAATLEAIGHPIPERTGVVLDEIAEHVASDLAAWRQAIGAS